VSQKVIQVSTRTLPFFGNVSGVSRYKLAAVRASWLGLCAKSGPSYAAPQVLTEALGQPLGLGLFDDPMAGIDGDE
jgi:hypothetical protein